MAYKLTVRRGPRVERRSFADLDAALAALDTEIEVVRSEGGLPGVSMVRDFGPGDRVAARLELSTGRLLRGRSAGVDVMGDGSTVAYAGGVQRRALDLGRGETLADALRKELAS